MVAAAVGAGVAVSGVAGAAMTSSASESAAQTQEQAAQSANATQLAMYDQNQANLQPFLNEGTSAIPTLGGEINTLQGMVNNANPNTAGSIQAFENTPGYKFQLQQGEQAIQNSAAASGGLLGGATLQSLLSYGQGLAGTTYQQYLNNLNTNIDQEQQVIGDTQQQVNTGLSAGGAIAGVSENAGNNISANTIGAGNAAAAGEVGSANAIANGVGSVGSAASTYGLLSQLTSGSSYGAGAAWTPSTGVSSGEAAALNQ